MRYLIGFGLILAGGISTALTGFVPLSVIMFVGVFMFASFPSEAVHYNYVIANTDEAIVRKRYYMIFIPFMIISVILTFGKGRLMILWKQEYYRVKVDGENSEMIKISRKEYVAIRNAQRKIYSEQQMSKEFMESAYSVDDIGYKRKKRRLVLAIVFACIIATMIFYPGGIALVAIYEAVFLPMVFLWIPDYKDAKILQKAYDKAMKAE